MNEQVEKIFAEVGTDTLTLIARGVIDDDSATLVGDPVFAEITTSHNDDRTIGIVKVSGSAVSVRHGSHHSWSSVVKIIDQSVSTNDAANWGFPENEVKVYDLGLLVDDGVQLRPAKCYLTQKISDGLHVLWLEDLSGVPQPPWTLNQFVSTARHLGQFNGYHFANKTKLPIEVSQDAYYLRMTAIGWHSQYSKLVEMQNDPMVRRVFRDIPLEPGLEYTATYERAIELAKSLPHGLSFGDSHPRNLFPLGSETVGIDWANLTYDPIGCDIGVLIGSPFIYTEAEIQCSSENEKEIYESYIDGLKSSGWAGNLDHVRLGFCLHFFGYLLMNSTYPLRQAQASKNPTRRAWLENRTQTAFEDIPELKAQSTALIPKYGEELKLLLKRVEDSI
jgi:hypothetical protein